MTVVVNHNPVKEVLTPDPDGIRTDFYTSRPYVARSVSVWLNGLRLDPQADDAFLEVGGNTIRMKEAPWAGDSLQVQYDAA